MYVRNKQYSLSKNYFYFTAIISLLIFIFYLWVGWLNYNKIKSDYHTVLEYQLSIIDSEIIKTFDYIAYLSIFVQNQIVNYQGNVNQQISQLFNKLDHDYRKLNLPPISMFTWLNKDKELVISSRYGKLATDNVINLTHRKSLYLAARKPNKIYIDEPTYGSVSKLYLLPVVRSVVSKDKELLGYINIGLSIDGLSKYFESTIDTKRISYFILTDGGKIITQSSQHEIKIPNDYFIDKFKQSQTQELKFNNVEYALIKKSSKYPLIIGVGYYDSVIWEDIMNSISLQLAPFILMCILFIVILYEFRHRLFKPLFALTKCADQISQGNLEVEIPELEVIELNNFATHLGKIKSYISEIIEIENKLLVAKFEAERANNAKSQFLANMSHELRTPLFTVTGYAEAIKERIYGPLNAEYLIASDNILYAGNHLLQLINDILDLSKAESGNLILDEEFLNIQDNIETCIQFINQMAHKKSIRIINQYDEKLPKLFADELRFRQIILNLLSNAVKFTNENGLIIVSSYYDVNKEKLTIIIKDNGVGVKKEEIPLILSEFGQAKNAYYRDSYQGTGLGLPLAIKFIQIHQGAFDFTSEFGKGTAVIITFPRKRLEFEDKKQEIAVQLNEFV